MILSRRDRDAEKAGAAETHTSETILSNIRVLAIDQTLGEKDGQKVVIGKTTTLELTPRQAETLALSRQLGTLSLALRSLADANEKALPSEDERCRPQGRDQHRTLRRVDRNHAEVIRVGDEYNGELDLEAGLDFEAGGDGRGAGGEPCCHLRRARQ